jgi:hypothetical protein
MATIEDVPDKKEPVCIVFCSTFAVVHETAASFTEICRDANLSTSYPVFRALFNDVLVAEGYFVRCLPAVLFEKECTAASLVSSKRRWDLLGTMLMSASSSVSQAEGWPVGRNAKAYFS